MPLSVWALIGFLGADGCIHAAGLARAWFDGELAGPLAGQHFLASITAALDGLLLVQLLLRSLSARVWGTVYFVLMITEFTIEYGFLHPESWLAIPPITRLQEIGRLVFFTAGAMALQSAATRRAFAGRPPASE